MQQLAEVARDMVPSAVGAGATLIDSTGTPTSTSTTDKVAALADQLQYDLDQGPCLSAWATWSLKHVRDTNEDEAWPEWAAADAELWVRSAISAPIIWGDHSLGALKVYSTSAHAFTALDEHRLQLLAGAAAALLGASADAHTVKEAAESLSEALMSRRAVETATGMLMERHGSGHSEARLRLLELSRQRRESLAETANAVLGRSFDQGLS